MKKALKMLVFIFASWLLAGLSGCGQQPGETNPGLVSLEVTRPPNKTVYVKNEAFDPAGLVVTGTYSDGASREVTGYTLSPVDTSSVGKKTVTLSLEGSPRVFPCPWRSTLWRVSK